MRIGLSGLKNNGLFLVGSMIILITLAISLGGAAIRPDDSAYANDQHLELAALKPLTTVQFLTLELSDPSPETGFLYSHFIGRQNGDRTLAIDSAVMQGDLLIYRPYGRRELKQFVPDNANIEDLVRERTFILGTDRYGRDLLSRLMSGAYISLSVGLISVLISLILGIFLGMWAGYYRGWHDRLILWLINVVWSVPTLLLVISITLVLGKGFWQIFVAVGLTMWVEVARVVRGQVMSMREKEFVEAGKVLGMSDFRIMMRHILPNISGPVIVISAANFATAILLEAGLSFLGIGSPPPQATWGKMISEHKAYLITGDAHLAIVPGLAIMLLVLSFTFIGNAIRDANDERLDSENH